MVQVCHDRVLCVKRLRLLRYPCQIIWSFPLQLIHIYILSLSLCLSLSLSSDSAYMSDLFCSLNLFSEILVPSLAPLQPRPKAALRRTILSLSFSWAYGQSTINHLKSEVSLSLSLVSHFDIRGVGEHSSGDVCAGCKARLVGRRQLRGKNEGKHTQQDFIKSPTSATVKFRGRRTTQSADRL